MGVSLHGVLIALALLLLQLPVGHMAAGQVGVEESVSGLPDARVEAGLVTPASPPGESTSTDSPSQPSEPILSDPPIQPREPILSDAPSQPSEPILSDAPSRSDASSPRGAP
ncbi:MAG: hypothetical protein V3T33_10830, partial [Myxococcota bacterium]